MSDAASYRFLSVLRRGLAAKIPPNASAGPRIAVTASFTVGGQPVTQPPVALRGPGDIIGFDTAAICRTWPTTNDRTAEPNYFALAEFRDGDLPWRYTPQATGGDRLAPWLCLIVVKDSEVSPLIPATKDRPLAVLTVNDAGALPDLSQAWAWAHAQIAAAPQAPATDFDSTAVATLLTGSPEVVLSRLLCPRKLDPRASYLACIVPTFERGRLAGLGQPVDNINRLAPAWNAGASPVTLPVYYSWRFQTGQPGDFASLAHQLVARDNLPQGVWQRDLAVSAPGANPPVWQVVHLEGALRTIGPDDAAWSTVDAHGFTAALAPLVNGTSPTVLGPPLYGRWLAATPKLSTAAGATPAWFHTLNGDPRARVAAGLGTLVVQSDQQALLAQAWTQVDGIRQINQKLRLSQLARELATRLHDRHFSISGDAFLQLTAPLHGHVRSGATTARAQLSGSPIASGALGAAWRRVSRPLGSLGVRQGRPSLPAPTAATGALARMNLGTLAILPAPTPPPAGAPTRLGDLSTTFAAAGKKPTDIGSTALPSGFTLQLATRAPVAPAASGAPLPAAAPPPPTSATAASAFQAAVDRLMQQLSAPLAAGARAVEANLTSLSQTLATALHPKQTIEAPLAARLNGVASAPGRTDPIEPVMASPDLPQPTYQSLGDQSQAWLIPGLDQVPADTVAALTTNWPFVEAFLVGLNHEMARKLLWNGYPTDQRGTYFRHFWDSRGTGSAGDIGGITQWTGDLGKNRIGATDPMVLLLRGELIRRYPNVIVYAAQGVTPTTPSGTKELQPAFFARLDPDVALFGFALDPKTVRADPSWYFVLQEHPSEPRFGLAAEQTAWGAQPASWDALSWDQLVASEDALASLRYIDLNAALPQNPPTADTTGAVWHAGGIPGSRSADIAHITFRPPQRLAIQASMLIPAGSPK